MQYIFEWINLFEKLQNRFGGKILKFSAQQ